MILMQLSPITAACIAPPPCHFFPAMGIGVLMGLALAVAAYVGYMIYLDYTEDEPEDEPEEPDDTTDSL